MRVKLRQKALYNNGDGEMIRCRVIAPLLILFFLCVSGCQTVPKKENPIIFFDGKVDSIPRVSYQSLTSLLNGQLEAIRKADAKEDAIKAYHKEDRRLVGVGGFAQGVSGLNGRSIDIDNIQYKVVVGTTELIQEASQRILRQEADLYCIEYNKTMLVLLTGGTVKP